ncbi:hypothetical protein RHMOL_Rhmol01G0236100 [Rhododendron molle]|uniref:Uncharacterized protein n=1 Tax=Rhododendron molle TaxID=49168 RepID=A0ACC0Q7U3_RHOML|nr:hypothetical protein RHMOL_Rhmol01G0236100 [Rhododendron molle]
MVTSLLDSACKPVSIQHICCIDTSFDISGSSAFGLRLSIHRPWPPDGSLNLCFWALGASFLKTWALGIFHNCSKLPKHSLFNNLLAKQKKKKNYLTCNIA